MLPLFERLVKATLTHQIKSFDYGANKRNIIKIITWSKNHEIFICDWGRINWTSFDTLGLKSPLIDKLQKEEELKFLFFPFI